MNYILSKYTFAVSKRTSSGQEICLLFSGRTGKNILVSKKVFSIASNPQPIGFSGILLAKR
ncbi:hypothetical protein, partial [Segatella copri]|uniref:hypothetical protein n=1 Tax=Segatella copri TaxID=165179 RepID=UPI001C708F7B